MLDIKVLYLDDEENNLNSFKAAFRRQYKIYTALTADKAINLLDSVDINVVISDQRMPEVTGVEFFKIIKEKYPEPVRILLTGYTDIEALADAINKGDIYRYVTKPWNELELHNSILNAYDLFLSRKKLDSKIEELQRTNDQLNRFIYSISHELRSPLSSALGIINLVKLEDKFYSTGEYWELMEICTNKLDYYINKTLQYYKNNRFDSVNEKIDFKDLINNIIQFNSSLNVDQNVKLDVEINQDAEFYGDDFRIEIILSNLISNAIKYQRDEEKNKYVGIKVNVSEYEALIDIEDNGTGILDEHLNKIFTQFFKSQKGVGLGLFIVKEALNKIGGKISIKSNVGSGTTFTIVVPNVKI